MVIKNSTKLKETVQNITLSLITLGTAVPIYHVF